MGPTTTVLVLSAVVPYLLVVNVVAYDDTTPLEVVVTKLAADLSRLEAQLTATQAELSAMKRKTGFMAQFSAGEVTGPATGPFRFDHVLFNVGGDYDPSQGIFTAPYAGVFVFTVKMLTAQHDQRQAVDLMVNFVILDRIAYDNLSGQAGHWGNSHSMSVVTHLALGDRVWVQPVPGYTGGSFYGGFHSTFSGSLLYAD